jgi:hypothetical protein
VSCVTRCASASSNTENSAQRYDVIDMSKKRLAGEDEVLAYSESKKPRIGILKSALKESSQQNLQNESYTVGWICAITTKYVAG